MSVPTVLTSLQFLWTTMTRSDEATDDRRAERNGE